MLLGVRGNSGFVGCQTASSVALHGRKMDPTGKPMVAQNHTRLFGGCACTPEHVWGRGRGLLRRRTKVAHFLWITTSSVNRLTFTKTPQDLRGNLERFRTNVSNSVAPPILLMKSLDWIRCTAPMI
jgi:hypothetical protein